MDKLYASIVVAISSLVGILIGWLLKQRYTNAEIDKLKAEKIKYAGENLEKLQEKRRSYDNACEKCKQIALSLISKFAV